MKTDGFGVFRFFCFFLAIELISPHGALTLLVPLMKTSVEIVSSEMKTQARTRKRGRPSLPPSAGRAFSTLVTSSGR